MRDIGKNIRDLRLEKGLTQDELAEKLYVTRQTVSNYEVGKSRPDVEMLVKIAEVLETDVNAILYGPAPKVDKRRLYIPLAVGAAVTAVFGGLWIGLLPVAAELRKNFITGLGAVIATGIMPMFWLCFGWTAAQCVSAVLGKAYTPPKWARYVKWLILSLLLVYFVPVLYYDAGILYINALVLRDRAAGMTNISHSWEAPQWVTFMIRLFFDAGYTFHLSENMGIFYLPGIALWLCGFPKVHKKGPAA